MKALLYFSAALCPYLISGLNPAIIMSKLLYKKDIRECGSGNPGFTNFKRTFGNKWAWWVFALDLAKAAVALAVFAHLFEIYLGDYQLGAAYTGLFAMLGHSYPIWYKFKGGKGFSVYMATIWFVDARAGLIATVVLVLLLLVTKYMSLSTMSAVASTVIFLAVTGSTSTPSLILCTVQVLFIIFRHRENILRLIHGTESKFVFKST